MRELDVAVIRREYRSVTDADDDLITLPVSPECSPQDLDHVSRAEYVIVPWQAPAIREQGRFDAVLDL